MLIAKISMTFVISIDLLFDVCKDTNGECFAAASSLWGKSLLGSLDNLKANHWVSRFENQTTVLGFTPSNEDEPTSDIGSACTPRTHKRRRPKNRFKKTKK